MIGIAGLSSAVWAISNAFQSVLFSCLLWRRSYSTYLVFFTYIAANLLQALVLFISYRIWGYESFTAWEIAWCTQAVVMIIRALAVAEICHHLFEEYRGIWLLIRLLLLVSAAIVLMIGVFVSRHNWVLIMPMIQRGLDMGIATSLVGLFIFARYYQVRPSPVLGALAIGFLLFSCFNVLNATVLERVMESYNPVWSLLGVVAFTASLVIWTAALLQPQMASEPAPILGSSEIYRALAPEVNLKLRKLNDQLSRFWKVETNRP
jgi:hypothetical protein